MNIATDLEESFLKAIGREERLTNVECKNLEPELLQSGRDAVEKIVTEKMTTFLLSGQKAICVGKE